MSRERRYWRPETEKLLAALGTVRDMEMKRLMVQPVVIQATEQERKQMEERFLDQMIQPVDFSSMTSAMVPEVTLEDLIRTIEKCERQVAIDKEAQEFLKELERLAYGYDLKPFPTQPTMSDLYNYRFGYMDERMTVEVLAVYEQRRKKNKSSPHHSPGGGCSCLPVCKQIVNTQKVGSAFFAKICYFGIKDTARPLGGTRKGGADRGKNEQKKQKGQNQGERTWQEVQ